MSSFIWSSGLGNEASSKVAVGRLQASDISAVVLLQALVTITFSPGGRVLP